MFYWVPLEQLGTQKFSQSVPQEHLGMHFEQLETKSALENNLCSKEHMSAPKAFFFCVPWNIWSFSEHKRMHKDR